MKDLFVPFLFFLILGVLGKGISAEVFPKQIVSQVVFVESESAFGSGVILGTNYVLTAAHIDGGFFINGLPCSILKKDSRYDLIYLQTKFTFDKSRHIKFASTLSPGESVWIVGCFQGKPALIHGYVSRLEDDCFFVDAKIISGFSGGGVFNEQGEFVGLYVGGSRPAGSIDGLGVAWNLKRIYTFLDIDFAKAKVLDPK